MVDVPVGMIPYGRRSDGSYGLFLDSNGNSLVSEMEILSSVPSASDPNNFVGRLVFSISDRNIFVFTNTPANEWISLKAGQVKVDTPEPSSTPTPDTGDLYYSTTTEVLYIWDGSRWTQVGGLRGANVIWRFYPGDGVNSLFDTGATTLPPVEYVQVFKNGLELSPGSSTTRDYYMIGNQVQLNTVPSPGDAIAIRTLTYITMARNANFVASYYVADGTANSYDTGMIQAKPGQIIVVADGAFRYPDLGNGPGSYDYKIVTQNVNVVSLISSGTTVTMSSQADHGFTAGQTISIYGALQSAYNGTFVVASVPTSKTLTYVASTAPSTSPATPNPAIYFGPVRVNDKIVFYDNTGTVSPLPSGTKIYIDAVQNVVAENVTGEANTVTNLGTGTGLFTEKVGVNLQFKSIKPGTRIDFIDDGQTVTINANADSYVSYAVHNGVSPSYTVTTESYVGCRNTTTSPITVDLSGINSPAFTGRKITIKDEARNSSSYNISIKPAASSSIEGQSVGSSYVINSDGKSVTMVFDGYNWGII